MYHLRAVLSAAYTTACMEAQMLNRHTHTSAAADNGTLADPLTQRDAWAAHFDGRLRELKEPRVDCPTTLPDVPKVLLTGSS